MRKLFSPPALFGFACLDAGISLVVSVSMHRWPDYVAFLAGFPFVLMLILAPLSRRFSAARSMARAARFSAIVYFIALISAARGIRELVLLDSGKVIGPIAVAEAASHPEATGFEFTDARGRADMAGTAENVKSRSADTWYAVPLVSNDWTPAQPVTAWALSLDSVPEEVLSGQFRAGLLCDQREDRFHFAERAIQDALARHHLRSDPHAVVLTMDRSVEHIRQTAVAMIVLAFAMINLYWTIAVLVSQPSAGRSASLSWN